MKRQSLAEDEYQDSRAIIVGGESFDIGVEVLRWDTGGFNGYDESRQIFEVEDRKTGKLKRRVIKGKRYGNRISTGQRKLAGVDQFIIHHTGGFRPDSTFNTLHNRRRLSVHFILSDKGVIYQCLDALETAWHAGKSNARSIGVECCSYADAESNPGAYSEKNRVKHGLAVHEIMEQRLQGRKRKVFALPRQQVVSLIHLVAGVWVALGNKVQPYFPIFESEPSTHFEADYRQHQGCLLHANVSPVKWDCAGLRLSEFETELGYVFREMRAKYVGTNVGPSKLWSPRKA